MSAKDYLQKLSQYKLLCLNDFPTFHSLKIEQKEIKIVFKNTQFYHQPQTIESKIRQKEQQTNVQFKNRQIKKQQQQLNNKMKPSSSRKQPKQSVKLPSIGNKTMGDITKQSFPQKQRPLSSKNIVTDLEKKLFSQLQSFDDKPATVGKSLNKMKKNSNASSCRDVGGQTDSMEKIAQLMPQLYSKIIQAKKYDQGKTLKQNFVLANEDLGTGSSKQVIIGSTQLKKTSSKQQKSTSIQASRPSSKPSSILITEPKQSQKQVKPQKPKQQLQSQPITDSFQFAQKQLQSIYQQYLQQQGLATQQTSITQLKSLNQDLGKCQVDIQELQKNYSMLIKQLGNLCMDELQ